MGRTRQARQVKKEGSPNREAASHSRSSSPTIEIDRKTHKSPLEIDPETPMPLTEAKMIEEIKEKIFRSRLIL